MVNELAFVLINWGYARVNQMHQRGGAGGGAALVEQ
jgi:hypothetical protein